MDNNNKNVPFASRRELAIAIMLACINIVLCGVVSNFLSVQKPPV